MQLIFTLSFLELFSVMEIYVKMSEILNFWLSALISQASPYLMFILVSKSTHPIIGGGPFGQKVAKMHFRGTHLGNTWFVVYLKDI